MHINANDSYSIKYTYTMYDLPLAKETDDLLVGFTVTEAVAALSDRVKAVTIHGTSMGATIARTLRVIVKHTH